MSTPGAELNLALKVTADTQAGATNLGQVGAAIDRIDQAAARAADALTRLAATAEGLTSIATASGEAQAAQVGLAESAQATTAALAVQGETADEATARIQAMVQASLAAAAAQSSQADAAAQSVAAAAATTRATEAQVAAHERAVASFQRSGAAVARDVNEIAALEAALKRGAKSTEELGALEVQLDNLMRRGALSTAEQTTALERLNQIEAKLATQRRSNSGSAGSEDGKGGKGGSDAGNGGGGNSFNNSFSRREFGRLAGDAVNGNWGRFEQTSLTLANSTGILSGIFSSTGIAIGAAAAVLGTFAAAALSASEDENKLNAAIAVTGNNAGLTSGTFEQLASGITSTNGKISASRELIEQLAASGKVGQQSLAAVAQAASDIGELTGANTEKAAQDALRYFDGTTAGAMKANEQLHFLTTTVYDQIKALEEAGDVQGAQDVAARAFHDAAISRIDDVNTHLTGLSKVWKEVGSAASSAWEQMKAGTSIALGTASDQNELYALQGRKASAQEGNYGAFGRTLNTFLGAGLVDHVPGAKESWTPDDEAKLQALQAKVDKAQADADAAAQTSRLNDAALKANASFDKRQEQYDKPTAKKHALDELDQQFLAMWNDPNADANPRLKGVQSSVDENGKVQFSGGAYDQQRADVEKKFTDRAGAATDRADLSAQTAQARQQLQLYTDAFTNAERTLDAARKAGTVSDNDYWAAKRKNIDDLESKQVAELEQEKAAVSAHSGNAAEQIRIDQQVQGINAQIEKAKADAAAKRAVLDDQEHQATEKKIDDANRLQAAYLSATGQSGQAAQLRIQSQYSNALKQANLNGDTGAAAKIKVIIDAETAKAQLADIKRDISDTLGDQQRQEQDIQAQLQAGLISQVDAQKQLIALHQQTYDVLSAQLPKVQGLAASLKDPSAKLGADQLASEISRIGLSLDQVTSNVRNTFQGSFDDVFNELGTRITNARQLLNTVVLDLARGVQRIAAQQLSDGLTDQLSGVTSWISQLLGGSGQTVAAGASTTTATAIASAGTTAASSIGTAGTSISTAIVDAGTVAASAISAAATGSTASGGSGFIGLLGSLFGGNSSAAVAANDGSGFSFNFAADAAASAGSFDVGGFTGNGPWDAVAGVVHGGEHVTRAAVVAQPGVRPMLDDLNTHGVAGLARHLPGFMDGGYVAPLAARASQSPLFPSRDSGMTAGRPPINLSVINVPHHSLVKDYLESKDGQETLLNTIDNNPTRVKRSIGG